MYASLVSRARGLLLTMAALLACTALQPARADSEAVTGTPAPAFRLQDQHGNWVSLAEQKGKWLVLYFYPLDDSPSCTTEACEFRDDILAFRKLGVNVLGVSVQDVASKKQFATKHSLPFSLLADTDKSVAKAYGVLGIMGFARRETFIIDPAGRIAKHYATVDAKTHSKQLQADLKTLIKPAA